MTEYLTSDTDLQVVADAIRSKNKTTGQLLYPSGFVSAIEAIQTGVTPKLVITTSTGATVTAAKGTNIISSIAGTDGVCTIEIPEAGEWAITATLNGKSKTANVIVGTQTLTLKVAFDSVFENNTWADIIEACQTNAVPESWAIGSSKIMTINGADYRIDIIGKNHDDYADGSGKAPLTLMLHPAYDGSYRMHSTAQALFGAAAWRDCEMRTATLVDILARLPQEVQSAVREVNKLAGAWKYGSPLEVTDRLFLLSEIEITGTERYSGKAEGTQYEYYQTAANRIKTGRESENAVYWWTRSIQDDGTAFGIQVRSDGATEAANVTSAIGLSFAFCF